jgi:hypothetical protein
MGSSALRQSGESGSFPTTQQRQQRRSPETSRHLAQPLAVRTLQSIARKSTPLLRGTSSAELSLVRAHETCVRSKCFNLRLRRQAPHLGNDPPSGNYTQDFGPSRTPFASASTGACGLAGTSFLLRIIVLHPTIENSCAHLSPSPPRPTALIFFARPGK